MASRRSPRPARTAGRRRVSSRAVRGGKKAAPARRRTPKPAGGKPLIQPTAADLQALWLPVRRGHEPRVRLDGPISIASGIATRGGLLRNAATGLSGFRWDVPSPEPGRTVLWASLAFGWQFYEWESLSIPNHTSNKIFVDGSLDWNWLLTGNPFLFSDAPVFLSGAGHFTFNTFIVPGADGFDVGWLAPPQSQTFSSIPDKTDATMSSPLSRLLAMSSGGNLMLWFAMDFQNLRYRLNNGVYRTTGYVLNGGPDTLYYAYAYSTIKGGAVTHAPLFEG